VILLAMEKLAGARAPSSNAVLVVDCDGLVDAARVRHALRRFLPSAPWLGGRLARPRPWGRLVWRVPSGGPTLPPVRTVALATGGGSEIEALVDRELDAPIDPRREPPLRFTIATARRSSHLVLTWAHALMDPHGSEHLLRLLAEIDAHASHALPTAPVVIAPPDARSFRQRGALASRGAALLRGLAPIPPVSLAAGSHGQRAPAATHRHRCFRLAAPTAPADRLRRGLPWRLAVVARAMAERFAAHGLATSAPFVVPVSVNRRARGEHGPILGNYLSFHFARCRPPIDGDVEGTARALRDQLADAVRHDELEATWAGMSFARWRPLRGMFRELPWTKAGDLCSFHFADTDALLPDRADLFGARITGGHHVAAVPPRPGVGVFFGRREGVETVVVSWVEGVVDDADVAAIADVVQQTMGWAPVTA
jgi:hypothetical protein